MVRASGPPMAAKRDGAPDHEGQSADEDADIRTPTSIRPGTLRRTNHASARRNRAEPDAAGQRSMMLRTVHDHDDWNAEARGETPMQRRLTHIRVGREAGQADRRR